MSQKRFVQLLLVLVVVFGLFFFSEPSGKVSVKGSSVNIFGDISGEEVGKITLRKGSEAVELVRENGVWKVPARSGYAADLSRINALMLRLLALEASQKITSTTSNFESLGVADNSVDGGKGKLSLYADDGRELGSLLVGEARKKEEKSPFGYTSRNGQYVRRVGNDDVYLLADTFTLNTGISEWLKSTIFSVPADQVESVKQVKSDGTSVFEAVRGDSGLELKGLSAGEKPSATSLSGLSSVLENVRLSDVLRAPEEPAKSLAFDSNLVVELSNGLVYSVQSAEKDSKGYIRLAVEFSSDLKARVESRIAVAEVAYQTAKGDYDKRKSEAGEDKEKLASIGEPPVEPKRPTFSTPEEAKKLTDEFAPWVYEVAQYQVTRFRQPRSSLLVKPDGGAPARPAVTDKGEAASAVKAPAKKR